MLRRRLLVVLAVASSFIVATMSSVSPAGAAAKVSTAGRVRVSHERTARTSSRSRTAFGSSRCSRPAT